MWVTLGIPPSFLTKLFKAFGLKNLNQKYFSIEKSHIIFFIIKIHVIKNKYLLRLNRILKGEITMELKGKPIEMESLIEYQEGSVVSMEVIKKELGTVTIFAFDKGQGLSEHSAPFDAMVQIIDGEAEITLAGEPHTVKKGEFLIMPANVPHALQAVNGPYKMVLTMIKSE